MDEGASQCYLTYSKIATLLKMSVLCVANSYALNRPVVLIKMHIWFALVGIKRRRHEIAFVHHRGGGHDPARVQG